MAGKTRAAVRKPPSSAPRLRILLGEAIAVGPGKADLLAAIAAEGSISAAARTMGMSYRRAWLLVDELNRAFVGPVVVSETGGRHGGGAVLTALGLEILQRYRAMEQRAAASVADDIRAFRALLHGKTDI
jgi:molybdate transport system regulatory protein